MTPSQQEVKAQVLAVLKLMKPEWKFAVWDPEMESWEAWRREPHTVERFRSWATGMDEWFRLDNFDLPPFFGDWKESLVRREELWNG